MKAKCPCGYMMKLKPELAGKKVRCPKCGQVSRIPKSLGAKEKKKDKPSQDSPAKPDVPTADNAEPGGLAADATVDDFFSTSAPAPESKADTASLDLDFGGGLETTSRGSGGGSGDLDFDFGGSFQLEGGSSGGGTHDSVAGTPASGVTGPKLDFGDEEDSFSTAEGTVGGGAGTLDDTREASKPEGLEFELGDGDSDVIELRDDQILEMKVGDQVTRPAMESSAMNPARVGIEEGKKASFSVREASSSWLHYLGEAWSFPARGVAKWIILGYAPIFFIGDYFSYRIPFGYILRILLLGVYYGYLLQLISSSAREPASDPVAPTLEDYWGSFVRPVLLVSLTLAVAFWLPLVALVVSAFIQGLRTVMPVLIGLSVLFVPLYWPLAYMCAGVTDSFGSCNPLFVLKSITGIMPGYLLAALVFNLIGPLVFAPVVIANFTKKFPLSSGVAILIGILATIVSFYFGTVLSRLIGTYYYCNSERFKW